MPALSQIISSRWPEIMTFFLVFGRTGGLIISAPFWGGRGMPGLVRVWVAVLLSVAIYPLIEARALPQANLVFLVVAFVGEVLLGLVLGWTAQILFSGLHVAGQQLEIKMGLGLGQLVDPQSGAQTTIIASLLEMTAALVFLSMNGHELLIRALVSSYKLFPLAGEKAGIGDLWLGSTGQIFTIALRVSAPVVIGLLLTDVLMGVISRAVPHMNVFLVALPLQITLGALLFIFSLPALVWFCANWISDMGDPLSALGLAGAGR